MNILAVENDELNLEKLSSCIAEAFPGCGVARFTDPMLAAKYGASNKVDALFAEVNMRRMSGFELVRMLRHFWPEVSVNFVAETEEFKRDAWRIMADSYVLKPITAAALTASGNHCPPAAAGEREGARP